MGTNKTLTAVFVPAAGIELQWLAFHYDAIGDDHQNLNDEYFTIKNPSSLPAELGCCTVADVARHTFTFPASFVLQPGGSVTVHTGSGVDTSSDLYWGSKAAIWNNDHDTAYFACTCGNTGLADYKY
jgi:hypothetical protein